MRTMTFGWGLIMTRYSLLHLKDTTTNNVQALLRQVQAVLPGLAESGVRHYGLFAGLFGLATNELYWVTGQDGDETGLADRIQAKNCSIIQRVELRPTVRPTTFSPPARAGVYVFRWFEVKEPDVEEIAQLSEQAWVSFEGGFQTEIQGLFAEGSGVNGHDTRIKMILLTWYQDLGVWERSRTPSPQAMELFMKRQQLTQEATPIPTRLIAVSQN